MGRRAPYGAQYRQAVPGITRKRRGRQVLLSLIRLGYEKSIIINSSFIGKAVFFWRNGRIAKNTGAPLSLPTAYFAEGNAQEKCSVTRGESSSQRLAFCEDAVFWDTPTRKGTQRRILISCDNNRLNWNTVMGPLKDPNGRGALWIHDPNSKKAPQKIEFVNYPSETDFHPLGISVLPGATPSASSQVIVVNHGRHNTTIEEFSLSQVSPYRATHIRTLSHPEFISPNAVSWSSSTSFYVTQDRRFTRRLPGIVGKVLPMLETLLLPGLSRVNHVTFPTDSSALDVKTVISWFSFPNGISISPNGNKVAIASSSASIVRFYNRSIEDNTLIFDTEVEMPFSPDNIDFEKNGKLTVAGHPDFLQLIKVSKRKAKGAPSWVVSLSPRTASLSKTEDDAAPRPASLRASPSDRYEVRTLYQGTKFGTSTTGLWDEGSQTLFVVGLYEDGLLVCKA
ncbi:hypothetical protein M422DRAFT_49292 [Sphaerobolus stellatus SS14]|uniref:Unplaced genomic scaffold SPHSTscaffold_71, whole genome shotgun sequence n=1 Tax=Sphaerobolus stellatus (strain SS14) TaxID=990650 RepID=A0A0C9UZ22_SPHS4|nr:hypothetical protein M422DRAFT_49292 [Sphaerobolus stellatus SS14]